MSLNFVPIIAQFTSDFRQYTIGLLTVVFPDHTAGALFHLGYTEDGGISFDIFWLQLILQKFN